MLLAALTPASAVADTIVFDHGAVKISVTQDSALTIVEPTDPLEINNVTFGPGNAFASSTPADFDFTPHTGTLGGIGFTIDLTADAPVTGTFDPVTGAMATDATPFTVTVDVGPPDNGNCTYTGPLSLSTQNSQVILGDPFEPGGPPFLNGAIATTWRGVPGDPDAGCWRINNYAKAQGGFWFSNGIEKPVVVPTPPVTCPKGQKLSRGRGGLKCVCKKPRLVQKKGKCVKRKRDRKAKRQD